MRKIVHNIASAGTLSFAILLAACQTGGTGITAASQTGGDLPAWVDATPNESNAGSLPWENHRIVNVKPDGEAIVVGIRNERCGGPAPEFVQMMQIRTSDTLDLPDEAKPHVTLFNAGKGFYPSPTCGALERATGVGIRVSADYGGGDFVLKFFKGGPWVNIHINRS